MRVLGLLLVLGLLAGCDDAAVVQSNDAGGTVDTSVDTAKPGDTGQADASQNDSNQGDASATDAGVEDVGAPSTCEPGTGCFGEPCGAPDDCLSGICTVKPSKSSETIN